MIGFLFAAVGAVGLLGLVMLAAGRRETRLHLQAQHLHRTGELLVPLTAPPPPGAGLGPGASNSPRTRRGAHRRYAHRAGAR